MPSKGAVSRGKLRRRPTHQHMNMKPPHISRPGSTPATNRSAIDALAVNAKRIIGIDGGIRMSMVAAAASVAAEKAAGYPRRLCQGIMSEPMAEASATAEPDTPPNSVEDRTPTWAGPPWKRPSSVDSTPTSASPSLPPIMRLPVSMKKGMAISGKLCTCATICCTSRSRGTLSELAAAAMAATSSA